jgi:ADP-ribose pyrophosphatase YjhB (NUDIX family)/N-acetylglutamate synthase-like GNAT family acetyltransferase
MTIEEERAYCPRCGAEMTTGDVGGRQRALCPTCGFVLYHNPVPGVGVLVEIASVADAEAGLVAGSTPGSGQGIVLVQRGEPPFKGRWALPAGYIEADESVEQAALRECQEETGLEVELLELFGVYSFPEGPIQSGIIIFFRARPVGGTLEAGDDAQEVHVFSPEDLPEDVAFRTHREVLERWVRSRSPEFRTKVPGTMIREARPEDEERVLELLPLIPANQAMNQLEREAAAQRFRESLSIDVLVAEVDGEVRGFLVLAFVPTLSGLRALIDDQAVDPDYRRQGLGAALVEAAIQRASRRGATHLLVDTSRGDPAAQDFYKACGFEAEGIAPLRIR